jgi:hypothetical protein
MITKEQALTADMFHAVSNGRCMKWRRNGRTKTWKRSPERFSVPVSYGLYDHWYITEENAHKFHVPQEWCTTR